MKLVTASDFLFLHSLFHCYKQNEHFFVSGISCFIVSRIWYSRTKRKADASVVGQGWTHVSVYSLQDIVSSWRPFLRLREEHCFMWRNPRVHACVHMKYVVKSFVRKKFMRSLSRGETIEDSFLAIYHKQCNTDCLSLKRKSSR